MKLKTSDILRLFCSLVFGALMSASSASPSVAEELPYQPYAVRQLCSVNGEPQVETFASPGRDRGISLPVGTPVLIDDVSFDGSGQLYFRAEYPTGQGLERATGYIRAEAAPNYCNYSDRQQPTLNRFVAPPNTCHLIAASRRTVAEVNDFAASYADFLPSMMVYRADNGWYAVSLGLIPTAREAFLRANTTRIPPDSYCSDGARYVAALDRRGDVFMEIEPAEQTTLRDVRAHARSLHIKAQQTKQADTFRRACDLGEADSCAAYANALRGEGGDTQSVQARNRYDLLACMGGVTAGCNNAFVNIDYPYLDHAMRTAMPDRRIESTLSIIPELAKIGCDMGYPASCMQVLTSYIGAASTDRAAFATAVAAGYTACLGGRFYNCREFSDLFRMKQTYFSESLSASDYMAVGARWEEICSHQVADNSNKRCNAGYPEFSSAIWARDVTPEQTAHARAFLREGCERGNANACARLARPESGGSADDRAAAARAAIAACQGDDAGAKACDDLPYYTDDALIPADSLAMTRYTEQAEACAGGSPYECGRALCHYAREISNDDLTPVINMLRENCTSERVTGCDALASAYGSHKNHAAEGTITVGIDDPVLLIETLRLGCGDLMAPGNTCDGLGAALAKSGDIAEASAAYNKGCTFIMDLGHGQASYGDDWECYNGAKHALLVAKEYATANQFFSYVCDGKTAGLAPFSCKYLGRIYDGGLGVERDADTARDYFAQSCFHHRVEDSDGEGCLLYGKLLIRDREAITRMNRDALGGVAMPQNADSANVQHVLEDASRAFQRGCKSRIPLACEANTDLLAQRLDGAFAFETTDCFVRDKGDPDYRVQICRSLTQFPNFSDPDTQSNPLRETVFIWPDQDRTILQQSGDIWRLNGNRTSGLVADRPYNCIANPATGREFCAVLVTR